MPPARWFDMKAEASPANHMALSLFFCWSRGRLLSSHRRVSASPGRLTSFAVGYLLVMSQIGHPWPTRHQSERRAALERVATYFLGAGPRIPRSSADCGTITIAAFDASQAGTIRTTCMFLVAFCLIHEFSQLPAWLASWIARPGSPDVQKPWRIGCQSGRAAARVSPVKDTDPNIAPRGPNRPPEPHQGGLIGPKRDQLLNRHNEDVPSRSITNMRDDRPGARAARLEADSTRSPASASSYGSGSIESRPWRRRPRRRSGLVRLGGGSSAASHFANTNLLLCRPRARRRRNSDGWVGGARHAQSGRKVSSPSADFAPRRNHPQISERSAAGPGNVRVTSMLRDKKHQRTNPPGVLRILDALGPRPALFGPTGAPRQSR